MDLPVAVGVQEDTVVCGIPTPMRPPDHVMVVPSGESGDLLPSSSGSHRVGSSPSFLRAGGHQGVARRWRGALRATPWPGVCQGGRADPRRGHQREQGGRGWADAGRWACVKSGFIFPILAMAMSAEVGRPWFLTLLAEVYGRVGQPREGLPLLTEAIAIAARTDERWWEADHHRLQGDFLLVCSGDQYAEAEVYFHKALDIARRQEAKSLELRTAASLARLWQQQGKRTEARELLAPIYDWFTEGFDTPDLQEAKALLEALA
jgi:tetratricopeptide (TPR) repeat protein